jgi:MIP family channel proteins
VEDRGVGAYVAEFLGTLLLVFFIGMVLAVQSKAGLGYTEFAVIGLVHVFVLSMLIYVYGGTSGAHFNPAVTISLAAIRKIRGSDAVIYILLQLAGAIAAALLVKALLHSQGDATNYGATLLNDKYITKNLTGLLAEFMGTFALMTAIMGTAVNPRGEKAWAGFVIGGTLGAAVMIIGPLTGAGFNPARSFGPALVSGEWGSFGAFVLPYVLGPILGALAATFAYKAIAIDSAERVGARPVDTLD